jgi:acyl-CoA thioester hydrolase
MKKVLLSEKTEVSPRFSEVDSLGIVWHGNYLKYFEDGREAFGAKYKLGYLDIFKQGYVTPLVKISCDYKKTLKYGEKAIIEVKYVDSDAAKIIFKYVMVKSGTNEVVATGESVQVFLNKKEELHLTIPPFFAAWKKKWGITK